MSRASGRIPRKKLATVPDRLRRPQQPSRNRHMPGTRSPFHAGHRLSLTRSPHTLGAQYDDLDDIAADKALEGHVKRIEDLGIVCNAIQEIGRASCRERVFKYV